MPSDQLFILSIKEIKDQCIVFNGSSNETPPLQPPDGIRWRCIRIGNKEIHVPKDTDPQVGLTFALTIHFHLFDFLVQRLLI
jgi:hypothetical protein